MALNNRLMVAAALAAFCGSGPVAFAGTSTLRDGYNTGSLSSSDGTSATRSGTYTDAWIFTLRSRTSVTISMTSSFDNYLILYHGSTPYRTKTRPKPESPLRGHSSLLHRPSTALQFLAVSI